MPHLTKYRALLVGSSRRPENSPRRPPGLVRGTDGCSLAGRWRAVDGILAACERNVGAPSAAGKSRAYALAQATTAWLPSLCHPSRSSRRLQPARVWAAENYGPPAQLGIAGREGARLTAASCFRQRRPDASVAKLAFVHFQADFDHQSALTLHSSRPRASNSMSNTGGCTRLSPDACARPIIVLRRRQAVLPSALCKFTAIAAVCGWVSGSILVKRLPSRPRATTASMPEPANCSNTASLR